ncbi:MAG: T9SS type A sorting domain-containing protein, partial [Bacteroidales bacterium]|nr:T9SS type A sorting domain-containing protein [Bacteroidales bacterium]
LAKFDGTNWTTYNPSYLGLPDYKITSIAIDGSGTKWIGTDGGGLAKFDGTNWTKYHSGNTGLSINYVTSIAIDGNGTKWIGTFNSGLAKFDDTNWTTYNTSNSGLHDNSVRSIAIDGNGTKWIGTSAGLAVFNENGIPVYVKENIKAVENVNIYPNPAYDFFTIELLSNMNISFIEIVNIQGIIVKHHKFAINQNTIDVRSLSTGLYIVRMQIDKGIVMKKLIKQ